MDSTKTALEPGQDSARAEGSVETEAAILDAARDILAEGGVKSLSMRAVAERVGLSATALYRYFEGKDDLVRRVVRGGYRRFSEYMSEAVSGLPVGSMDRVLALGEAYVQFAMENREYFKVWFSLQGESPKAFEELPEGGGYARLRQSVADAIAAGEMKATNPDFAAHYLWTCAHGLVTLGMAYDLEARERCSAGFPESPVELYRAFMPLIRDGLASGNGAPIADRFAAPGSNETRDQ